MGRACCVLSYATGTLLSDILKNDLGTIFFDIRGYTLGSEIVKGQGDGSLKGRLSREYDDIRRDNILPVS